MSRGNLLTIFVVSFIGTAMSVEFWKQGGLTCAFMAANNCVQEQLYDESQLCDLDMQKLQCKGCWDEFMKGCGQCPLNHQKLTINPNKVKTLLTSKGYVATDIPTDFAAIVQKVIQKSVLCVLLDMSGDSMNHASTITHLSEPELYWYLDSNSDPNDANRKESYTANENSFPYYKSQQILKEEIQQWITDHISHGIDHAFMVTKRRNSAVIKTIQPAQNARKNTVANTEYHDILNDQYIHHHHKNNPNVHHHQTQKSQIIPYNYDDQQQTGSQLASFNGYDNQNSRILYEYDNEYGSKTYTDYNDLMFFGIGAMFGIFLMALICCICMIISYMLGLATNRIKSYFGEETLSKTENNEAYNYDVVVNRD